MSGSMTNKVVRAIYIRLDEAGAKGKGIRLTALEVFHFNLTWDGDPCEFGITETRGKLLGNTDDH